MIAPAQPTSSHAPPVTFELQDGDRVALIGDTFIEREAEYGYIETALTLRFPDRHITFRNLGWSGDTPAGASRGELDPPRSGWDRLQDDIRAVKPTVAILGYGMASSFDGEAGLPKFEKEMNALLDALTGLAGGPVRVAILGPIRHENLGPPWPDPEPHNYVLAKYNEALKAIAAKRGAAFVPLFELGDAGDRGPRAPPTALTGNGIHLNEQGYRAAVRAIAQAFAGGALPDLDSPRAGAVRRCAIGKNRLYFDRWRPQNAIYLFGSRKREQGTHIDELPQFDPLVVAAEAEIAKLRAGTAPTDPPKAAPVPAGPAFPAQPSSIPFDVADGFEISLFAATPQIAKPTQINFDPQGRLWVVTSSIYPQIEPGQTADDKVVILEDADHDGRADKVTVFADGLRIPTGVVPGDGGCYVGQGTQLLHFRDTDGGGRADERRVVLSGFGTEDTHHIIHTLRWGPDGCLYFNQSIYINSHIETPHGVVRLARGGVFRFDTRSQRLDVLAKGWNNPWGHAFDAYGNSFVTDASWDGGPFDAFPGAVYWDYAGGRKTVPLDRPRQPQFAGMEFVWSRQFPDDWQGNLLCAAFKGNRVIRYAVREKGSTFEIEAKGDLVRSTDITFRPIDVKLGPDGVLYIADWSNPIINHGEVDFRDPRRDKKLGRIWRVARVGGALGRRSPEGEGGSTPRLNLLKMSDADLLDQLKSPEGFLRDQARRVLAERGAKILPAIVPWASSQTDDRLRLEGMWMFFAAGGDSPLHNGWDEMEVLGRLLQSSDVHVRAAALRIVSNMTGVQRREHPDDAIGGLGDFFAAAVTHDSRRMDDHDVVDLLNVPVTAEYPRVRLEAVRALRRLGAARAISFALCAADKPMDPTLEFALSATLNESAGPWLAALESGEWKWEGREKQLDFALGALPADQGLRALRFVLKGREIPRDGSGPLIGLMGRAGGPEELRMLLDRLVSGGFEPAAQPKVLHAFAEAARLRGAKPSGDLEHLDALWDGLGAYGSRKPGPDAVAVRTGVIRLMGRWKIAAFVPRLLGIASDPAAPPEFADVAFESLREIGGKAVKDGLSGLCAKNMSFPVRSRAARILVALDPKGTASAAAGVLRDAPDEGEALALWRDFLGAPGWPAALLPALRESKPAPHVARAGLRILKERNIADADLTLVLSGAAGSAAEGRELTESEIRDLAARALKDGDPVRGEAVFLRKDLNCTGCHAVNGTGGKVGPDLGALGTASPPDYILESILYPSRKIKEGFQTTYVQTVDERIFTGRAVRESDQELVLLTAELKEEFVAKRDISERKVIPQSVMPAGLGDRLKPGELLDIVRFLSALGRPGPYDRYRLKSE